MVLEATYGWYWAADTLAAAGAEVHLAHPLGVKGFAYRRVKNDERDAADLADLRAWGSTWRDGLALPQPYAGKMASLRKICTVLAGEIALLQAAIAGLLEHHQGYRAVRALPGIGPVLGAVIVAEIGDITRFPRPAELCSWAGLDSPPPRVRRQGQPRPHHQAGIADLRWALIEAIQHVPAGHPLRQRKDDIITRRGAQARNIALKVAMARQLLTWVFYAMRDGQLSRPVRKSAQVRVPIRVSADGSGISAPSRIRRSPGSHTGSTGRLRPAARR